MFSKSLCYELDILRECIALVRFISESLSVLSQTDWVEVLDVDVAKLVFLLAAYCAECIVELVIGLLSLDHLSCNIESF